MMFVTHALVGVVVGLMLQGYGWWFFGAFILGSVLPDIDAPKSKVGKSAGIVSWILEKLFGHRGVFHSLLIPAIAWVALWYFGYWLIGLAFFLGYFLHLVLDALTLEGIRFFWPLSWHVKGFIRTGGAVEYVLLGLGIVLIVIGLF